MNEKIVTLEEMLDILKKNKGWGFRIIFTNGCFDILHVGHLHLFRDAKMKGGVLIVGLNSDDSVRRLKGQGKPIVPELERAEILANLELVDYVIIFNEDTPENLIKEIRPDVLVKGAEYGEGEIIGEKFVVSHGGKILRVPMLPNHSSRQILRGGYGMDKIMFQRNLIGVSRIKENEDSREKDMFEIEDSEMEKVHFTRADIRELAKMIGKVLEII